MKGAGVEIGFQVTVMAIDFADDRVGIQHHGQSLHGSESAQAARIAKQQRQVVLPAGKPSCLFQLVSIGFRGQQLGQPIRLLSPGGIQR